ncbi:unnamed protein product [Symbiodinium sp. CCMP2592]|nr:unnamed protein product [Symbiodinium sp. CCMP2592]
MELQEAAKSRRRRVVEKAKSQSVNREEGPGSSTSRREKRAAGDMEESRTPKKKRDKETKSPEEPRQGLGGLFWGRQVRRTEGSAPQKQAIESESTDQGKEAPARERGARPKAWSKPAAQDGAFRDTGAEERPFNVFRPKVGVSDDFADSGRHFGRTSSDDEKGLALAAAAGSRFAHCPVNEIWSHDKNFLFCTALSEPALPSASKKDRPKRKKTKAHVEKEETTPPKGKRIASPTPKPDRSDFSVQQELGQETPGEVRGAEDVMSVSSGSDNTDYGVMDCRFITENDAALGLRRRIQRHKTRALEEAKKDEKKARKKARVNTK